MCAASVLAKVLGCCSHFVWWRVKVVRVWRVTCEFTSARGGVMGRDNIVHFSMLETRDAFGNGSSLLLVFLVSKGFTEFGSTSLAL